MRANRVMRQWSTGGMAGGSNSYCVPGTLPPRGTRVVSELSFVVPAACPAISATLWIDHTSPESTEQVLRNIVVESELFARNNPQIWE